MRKKILLLMVFAVVSLTASAQFEQKKMYVSTALSGVGMSYSEDTDFTCGIHALGGYFIADNVMVFGRCGYYRLMKENFFEAGVGGRYYMSQNGIYLGGSMDFSGKSGQDYLFLTPEVGYAFFINRNLTIEPAVYYNMCLNDFSDGSRVGLKIGLGFYF